MAAGATRLGRGLCSGLGRLTETLRSWRESRERSRQREMTESGNGIEEKLFVRRCSFTVMRTYKVRIGALLFNSVHS